MGHFSNLCVENSCSFWNLTQQFGQTFKIDDFSWHSVDCWWSLKSSSYAGSGTKQLTSGTSSWHLSHLVLHSWQPKWWSKSSSSTTDKQLWHKDLSIVLQLPEEISFQAWLFWLEVICFEYPQVGNWIFLLKITQPHRNTFELKSILQFIFHNSCWIVEWQLLLLNCNVTWSHD